MKPKRKKRECLVRGNKVYFYGKVAERVEKAIKLSGLTPEEWLNKALTDYIKYLKEVGK